VATVSALKATTAHRMTLRVLSVLALLAPTVSPGCGICPPGGPTGAGVTVAGTLAPGEARAFDVDIPAESTQINVTVSWVVGLAVFQVGVDCPVEAVDGCPVLAGSRQPLPGPVESSTIRPGCCRITGPRVRVVVKNTRRDVPLSYSLSVEPYRAGCT
jgi:hypothetical protein